MIQDRVRRTWESGRAINPWLIHPPLVFALLLVDTYLKAEFVTAAVSDHLWWDSVLLGRAMGDLTLGDLERLRWAAAAVYFVICAVGAFQELRPVRLDPAPWRPVALGAMLLACAAASVGLLVSGTERTPREYVACAADDLDRRGWTEPLEWALDADLPGARQAFRERLDTPDPGMRALLAATLVSRGEDDPEVRRALRSGFEEGLAILEREATRQRPGGWDATDRMLDRLVLTWLTIDPDGCRASPYWRRWHLDPGSVRNVGDWWRESRERLTGES